MKYTNKRIKLDGFQFDSQKEAEFYLRYIKNCGHRFEVQKTFILHEKFDVGGLKMRSTTYKADFVIYDDFGNLAHVFDLKNGFNTYAIDAKSRLKFKLFAKRYGIPVEVVFLRKHDFKMAILGFTTKFEPITFDNIDYDLKRIIGA